METMCGGAIEVSSTFGGSDVAILINGVACGEILNLKYSTEHKTIKIKTGLFGELCKELNAHSMEEALTKLNNAVIEQVFANEKGLACYRAFKGVRFSHQDGEVDVDDVVNSETFNYHYDSKTNLYSLPFDMKTSDAIKELRKRNYIKFKVEEEK